MYLFDFFIYSTLKKRFISTILIKITLIFIFIVYSCSPDEGLKNPIQYEDYISISSDKTPSVSPDGNLIAYFHRNLKPDETSDYPTGLYIMNIDGSNRRLLLKGPHFEPSWSPDGKWLVFSTEGILQIISSTGDSIRTFGGINNLPLFRPNWSSDGQIIFSAPLTSEGGVFTMTPYFTDIFCILKPLENNGMYATYSPDNRKIIYVKGGQSLPSVEIFILNLLTMSEKRLTYDSNDDRQPSWSPTGNLIAWSCNMQVYIMKPDGTNRKRLDYGQYPAWTPEGEVIIYSFANTDFTKEVIWKIDINGKNKKQLTF